MYHANAKLGDVLAIHFSCTDASGEPSTPTARPTVSLYQGGSKVASLHAVKARDNLPDLYVARVRLGDGFSVGNLIMSIRWAVDDHGGRMERSIRVIAGGDREGSVISMYAFNRPGGKFVVAQCGGRVFRGKNPRFIS